MKSMPEQKLPRQIVIVKLQARPQRTPARSPVTIFRSWRGFRFDGRLAAPRTDCQWKRCDEEDWLPISALLARIRRLVPKHHDDHYQEIVRGFGRGALRPPPSPMSDAELARAIAEFLKETPSAETVSSLGRRLDPSSRI